MGLVSATKDAWRWVAQRIGAFVANEDPLAAAANTGAFIVWSNQPFYPLYVFLLVGRGGWPSLLTWLSTPFFFAVAPLTRRSSLAGRALFVTAGVANTLLTTKAFGSDASVGWFLVPCAILVLGTFRLSEWKAAVPLGLLTIAAVPLLWSLGGPLHAYAPAPYQSLSRLNIWSATVLSLYLIYAAFRARKRAA